VYGVLGRTHNTLLLQYKQDRVAFMVLPHSKTATASCIEIVGRACVRCWDCTRSTCC